MDDALAVQLAVLHDDFNEGGVRDQALGARLQNQPPLSVAGENGPVVFVVIPVHPRSLELQGEVDGGAQGSGTPSERRDGHGNGVMEVASRTSARRLFW